MPSLITLFSSLFLTYTLTKPHCLVCRLAVQYDAVNALFTCVSWLIACDLRAFSNHFSLLLLAFQLRNPGEFVVILSPNAKRQH